MKETKVKKQKMEPQSWVMDGNSISQDELIKGIEEAEKGPFYTVQESMENFELWMKSREKK
jgi:predicted transcriptional regulator